MLSQLEAQREAAAYTSEVGSSLESSESSIHDSSSELDVDEILARRVNEETQNVQYLLKYADYPLHKCSWEPKSNTLEVMVRQWKEERDKMGVSRHNQLCRRNRALVKEAKTKAQAAKERRWMKREKLRKEKAEMAKKKGSAKTTPPPASRKKSKDAPITAKQRRVVDSPDGDSSDDEPLLNRQNKVTSDQKAVTSNISKQVAEEVASTNEKGAPAAAKLNAAAKPPPLLERTKSVPTIPTGELYAPRDPGPIKFFNQTPEPQRQQWNTQNKLFKTLQYRGIAEKRSRREGVPGIGELEFVNGTPKAVPKKPVETTSKMRDDLYARREPGQRRVQEPDPDKDLSPRMAAVALQSYEVGKIPMTCFDWKHGNSCKFTAERCKFLHREKDQAGKPLQVTTWDGKVPPKYKNPRQTCYWWFFEDSCKKTADDCHYAHENTGHLSIKDGKTIPIDPTIQNGSAEARAVGGGSLHKHKDVTCWFWLTDANGCLKSADQCDYAHSNTGLLGNTVGADFQTIDPNEKPVRQLPKTASPPQTCFFWLRGDQGCNKTEEDCPYAHRNTRWLKTIHGKVEQIDPNEGPKTASRDYLNLPFSDRRLPLHSKTCFFWNESECTKPESACLSLHRYTGVVADPPQSWRLPPGWQQRLRDQPSLKQVEKPDSMQVDKPVSASALPARNVPRNVHVRGSHVPSPFANDSKKSAPLPLHKSKNQIDTAADVIQPADMKRKIEAVMPLNYEEMFSCNGNEYEDVLAQPNALVLYDTEEHDAKHELITRWLMMNHVLIFNSWTMGLHNAWDAFKDKIMNGQSGIIIAAPDYEDYASLPGFGDVLRGTVRLWTIGYQNTANYSIWDAKASQEVVWDRFQIFPHGGIIYITDDVFETKPQLALRIVEHFFAMIEAGRQVESDVISSNLQELYILLSDSGYCEPDGTFNHPSDNRPFDFFPIISMRQDLAEDIGLYYDARKRSLHDANTEMAQHYSALIVEERRHYRSYFVVHPQPEQVDWKDTITNIDEVLTPERCIEYFEQEAKGNRFENYAWAYPLKSGDEGAA
ncbi:hypothetical protein BU23DRAFT_595140 [Bimuria novae-zelandiae CBS 107.79]|uniref:Chromo domain-containing protein n=1 Tax=Bimuria novae-zelandiae CBS 107.79 TaxID=1447943 RepID=A0A6A5VQV7_9PLEO|nr:hypothetical protein BU23DRAFT_595140 [Bimuria novae-zelandiae CBS 107.79]